MSGFLIFLSLALATSLFWLFLTRYYKVNLMNDSINALASDDRQFSKYFTSSKDMLIILSSYDKILKCNDRLSKVTGYSMKELEGESIFKIIYPDDIDKITYALNDESKPGIDLENRLICSDGSVKYVSWRGTRNKDNYLFIRIIDLTDSVLREQHLRELNDDLEQLLYIASHDLREPLVGSAGFISLVISRNSSELSKEAKEFLTDALDGISLMEKKIDDLLLLSRVGRDFTDGHFHINDAFEASIRVLNGRLKDANIVSNLHEIPFHVKGNLTVISQVFQNLISNAYKYRDKNRPLNININYSVHGSVLMVTIKDNGIGFDQAHSERIFLPFQRLHTSESEYSGTGIGLALCRKIITKHGGIIQVESKLGEGSTFHFTLPVSKDSED